MQTESLAYTPQEAAAITRIGRNEIYRAIRSGELPAVRIGKRGRLVVPVSKLREWLDARATV